MQSKIRAGTIDEYKKEVRLMIEAASSYIKAKISSAEEVDMAQASCGAQENT